MIEALTVARPNGPAPQSSTALTLASTLHSHLPRAKAASARLLAKTMGEEKYAFKCARGFWMVGSKHNLDMMAFLKSTGGWNDRIIDNCLACLSDGETFFDIGANSGYVTTAVAAARPSSPVFAFEPLPDLSGNIAATAAKNDFKTVTVYELALSNSTGHADFYLPGHSIHASFVSRSRNARKIVVPTFRMDELIQSNAIPVPKVIKTDVEGAELQVFEGALQTLKDYKPTVLFESDVNCERFGYRPSDLVAILKGVGYSEIYFVDDASGERLPIEQVTIDSYGDYLATG